MKKRIACISLAIALIMGQIHAFDFSMGASFGMGMPVFRGEDAKEMMDKIDDRGYKKDNNLFSLSPTFQMDLLFGFSKYIALETGVGYRGYKQEWDSGSTTAVRIYSQNLIIPVMLRGQFPFGIFSLYASIGPKFNISFTDKLYFDSLDAPKGIGTVAEGNSFLIDLGFAIGFEIKLGRIYMGLRGGYDLNLMSPMDISDAKWYQDNFGGSLTFRRQL